MDREDGDTGLRSEGSSANLRVSGQRQAGHSRLESPRKTTERPRFEHLSGTGGKKEWLNPTSPGPHRCELTSSVPRRPDKSFWPIEEGGRISSSCRSLDSQACNGNNTNNLFLLTLLSALKHF